MPLNCQVECMSEYFIVESLLDDMQMEYALESAGGTGMGAKIIDTIIKIINSLIELITNWFANFKRFIMAQVNKLKTGAMKSNRYIMAEINFQEKRKRDLSKKIKTASKADAARIQDEIDRIQMRIDELREQFDANNKGVLITNDHYNRLTSAMRSCGEAENILKKSYNDEMVRYMEAYDDLIQGFNRLAYNANTDIAYKAMSSNPTMAQKLGSEMGTAAILSTKSTVGRYTRRGKDDVPETDEDRIDFNLRMDEIKADMFSPDGAKRQLYDRFTMSAKEDIAIIEKSLDEIPEVKSGKYIPDSYIATLQKTVNEADKFTRSIKDKLNYYKEVMKARKLYLTKNNIPENMTDYETPGIPKRLIAAQAPDYMMKLLTNLSNYITLTTKVYNLESELCMTVMRRRDRNEVILAKD